MTLHPTHPSLHVGFDKIPGMCSTPRCLIKKGAPNKLDIIVYMTNYELHRSGESGNLQGFPWDSCKFNGSKFIRKTTASDISLAGPLDPSSSRLTVTNNKTTTKTRTINQ